MGTEEDGDPMFNETNKYNKTFNKNDTSLDNGDSNETLEYIITCSILIILCIIAVIINIRILVSVHWVRRPLTPTLHFSLSLALADAYGATLIGGGLIVNSLLPKVFNIQTSNYCVLLTIEALRLAGIIITVIHLLTLAGNHYLGILRPFHSRRWMTHTNLYCITTVLWMAPISYFLIYFASIDKQGYNGNCTSQESVQFITQKSFRNMFSALFFIPLITMFFVYCHIFVIVRQHQASRRWFNRHSRRHMENGCTGNRHDQQQFDRNLKAIWTTSLILVSYLICFMPSTIFFVLVCDDCLFKMNEIKRENMIIVAFTSNLLLVTKAVLNPLIYASRMHEIRVATRRMNNKCRSLFCPCINEVETDVSYSSAAEITHQRFSFISNSTRRRNQCSLNSIHVGNGFQVRRSTRRRPEELTTDL